MKQTELKVRSVKGMGRLQKWVKILEKGETPRGVNIGTWQWPSEVVVVVLVIYFILEGHYRGP